MRIETWTIKDLPDLHRMGHTCANLNGELLFVWGGSNERSDYLTGHHNVHLWIYDTLTGYWRHRSCFGECPPNLSGATSCIIGRRMFIFGGHSTIEDNWLNSLYCLDLDSFIWRDLGSQARAEPSKPIRSDKNVSWTFEGRLYVFGGYGWSQIEHLLQLLDKQRDLQLTPDYRWPKFGWNNQLVEFNPSDNTWRWPTYSGKCPSARAAHSGALMGDRYYLFGGRDSRERLNDLYTFDMRTLQWTQIAVVSCPLASRLEQPIGHLLEPPEGEQSGPAMEVAEELDDGELALVDPVAEDIVQDVEFNESIEMTPSPSSAIRANEMDSSAQEGRSSTLSQPDGDEDDDEDMFEYPHPSHLLERWSLSSHQSASGSSNMGQINCLTEDQQSLQLIPQTADQNLSNLGGNQAAIEDDESLRPVEPELEELEEQPQQQQQQLQQPHQQIESNPMEQDAVEAPIPPGRSFASFTPISNQKIMLFGGVSSQNENLNDCWLFNIDTNEWSQVDLRNQKPRLWHTGSRTKNNEVIIIGGSCSDKIDEFCCDVLTISMEPKSLKSLSMDATARTIRMRLINGYKGLPSNINKFLRLRKQAMALTMRRAANPSRPTVAV